MPTCLDLARRIARRFPTSPDKPPTQNWLAKIIKAGLPNYSLLKRQLVLKMTWNPKLILLPEHAGMLITRISCLLASGMGDKAEILVSRIDSAQRVKLVGEASVMIRVAESDTFYARDSETMNVAHSIATAGYFVILLLAGKTGALEFPISNRTFIGVIFPDFEIPPNDNDPTGEISLIMFIMSRIEAFSRVSALCTLYGPLLSEDANPADLFGEKSMSTFATPIPMIVARIVFGERANMKNLQNPNSFFPEFAEETKQKYFYPREVIFIQSLPKNIPDAHEIRRDILSNKTYELWPGISEIRWREELMEGMRILPMPEGIIVAAIQISISSMPIERVYEIPPLDNAFAWEEQEEIAKSGEGKKFSLGKYHSPPLEAIRMCIAPPELKIRDGRVPAGFVSGGRKPSKKNGDIPIIFIPKTKTIYTNGEESGTQGEQTGITHRGHQVSGHLRQLPLMSKASQDAREAAKEYRIILPETGYTFVRPHVRGTFEGKMVFSIKRN